MIIIDGHEYRTLEEQVQWLTENHQEPIAEYLKSAEVEDNTLYITDQDGNTIEFQGGGATAGVQSIGGLTGVVNLANGLKVYSAVPGANAIMVKTVAGGGLEFGEGAGLQVDLDTIQAKLSATAPMYITNNTIILDTTAVADGTHDGTNWTKLKINGVEKNIPTGGSGQTYTAGEGLELTGNQFKAVCGDGVEIDTDNKIAAKISNAGGIGFDANHAITLNTYAKSRVDAVDSKSTVTASTTSQTGAETAHSITIDGTAYNLPEGSAGTTDFDALTNRPKYNGTEMTHSTNVPEVKTATWDAKQDTLSAGSGVAINSNTISAKVDNNNVIFDGAGNIALSTNASNAIEDVIENASAWSAKQDAISDLSDIRSGAAAGATAVQPATLANYSTTAQMNTAIAAHHDGTKQDTLTEGNHITIDSYNYISAVYQIEFLGSDD